MKMKVHLVLLRFLLASVTGVYAKTVEDIYVKANEMVVLLCPHYGGYNHGGANPTWTSYTTQEMDLTNMSSTEQRKMDMLVLGTNLVILKASVNHQGNYSCSLGSVSSQSWFMLTVYITLSREYEEMIQYSETCYTQESCKLHCPDANSPSKNTPNITRNSITWHKDGKSLPEDRFLNEGTVYYLSSTEKKDRGVYTCTRSYLYLDQIYNMSFTVVLDVQPRKKEKRAVIKSPHENEIFEVDLGSTNVINCTADLYSDFDVVFWMVGDSFAETNNSLSVFYNSTRDNDSEEMTASLVFTKVSEEDLSKRYTCKLQSASQNPALVNISLVQKARPSSFSLASSIVVVIAVAIVVTSVVVVIHVKFKNDIILFLQNTFGCYRNISRGSPDLVNYQMP